jgi:CarD family transcriptional regulator
MDRGIVMLSIGNKIFIPNYGAGIIKDIDFRKVFDTVYKTVIVTLVIDNMSLIIPVSRIEAYRVREIITKEELKRYLDISSNTLCN